ncbi:MAG TPA: hypothetical protein HA222_04155 [Candidatus Diapherotrites archaeon]|uniref:DUF7718 domain-containing protein n=1 Tax=Candidatus Iainarchaeum sp. TaxID=3101447 RepID=A0A7J4KYC2_9ARCH|nr:hypothetical protein [Candidatus Diapherotrites archaeon]HIH33307.1 hypothetical protein [Candidatus Diapherotrites archaeon]
MLHDNGQEGVEKTFERVVAISENDRIVLKARRVKKKITSLAIIGITNIEGREHQIVRFDMSHGFLHKDLLFEPKGGKERIFGKIDGKLVERIINETASEFEAMKRKYSRKIREGKK